MLSYVFNKFINKEKAPSKYIKVHIERDIPKIEDKKKPKSSMFPQEEFMNEEKTPSKFIKVPECVIEPKPMETDTPKIVEDQKKPKMSLGGIDKLGENIWQPPQELDVFIKIMLPPFNGSCKVSRREILKEFFMMKTQAFIYL